MKLNIVSVMAHQDDELMCLGTMLKYKHSGNRLAFVCLTDGSAGMVHQPGLSINEAAAIRRKEMTDLTDNLDAEYICLNRPDEFLYDTSELRLELIEALRYLRADLIFTHSNPDYNADHIYGWGGINGIITNAIRNKNTDIQSAYDKIEKSITTAIAKTVDSFNKNAE